MGVTAVVEAGTALVDPGSSSTRTVRVRNTGRVVDSITVDVVGDAGGWAKVEPQRFNLYPGDEQAVTVTFVPPRSAAVPAGRVPFAVRVLSHEDTAGSVVEEGEIEVAPFSELTAEVVPKSLRLKRRGRTEVAIDNVGNVPVTVSLLVEDDDQRLKGVVDPGVISLAPGKATFARVAIRPNQPFLKGSAKTLPFRVAVVPDDGRAPMYAEGVVLQEQTLPKWLVPAAVLAMAACVALFVLWQTLFKSAIESAAKDSIKTETAAAEAAAEKATESAESAEEAAAAVEAATDGDAATDSAGDAATDQAGGSEEESAAGGARRGTGLNVLTLGPQVDFRIQTTAAPGGAPVTSGTPAQPADKALLITDIVFQNPGGDVGTIRVFRGGEALLEVGLANFRDLDYHFVAPIRFDPGEPIRLGVTCSNAAPAPKPCTASAYFAGVAVSPEVLDRLTA